MNPSLLTGSKRRALEVPFQSIGKGRFQRKSTSPTSYILDWGEP